MDEKNWLELKNGKRYAFRFASIKRVLELQKILDVSLFRGVGDLNKVTVEKVSGKELEVIKVCLEDAEENILEEMTKGDFELMLMGFLVEFSGSSVTLSDDLKFLSSFTTSPELIHQAVMSLKSVSTQPVTEVQTG